MNCSGQIQIALIQYCIELLAHYDGTELVGIQHYLYTIKWIIWFICLILLFFPQLVNSLELIIHSGRLTEENIQKLLEVKTARPFCFFHWHS